MKQLKVAFLALLLITGYSTVKAQDSNNPWAIGVGVNAVDFYPTNAGHRPVSGNWYSEFFNATDHYNILPTLSRLNVSRYLADGFSFEVAGSLNQITKIGDLKVTEKAMYSADAGLKYDLNKIIGNTGWFNPYATVGGGYTWLDKMGTGTFNGGLGANIWFNDNIGLNVGTQYKHTFNSGIQQHWQHYAGIVIKFGGTDTDGDGVFDKDDACPDVFGLAQYKGCPDTDGDGIIDSKDACPTVAGLAALNGCPDADGDGIADKDDKCPNVKGTVANQGCPDTDGDGIIDQDDACPTVAGPAANKGCPWPDTDNDGVLDKDDKCPTVAGPASNNGCPEITQVEVEKLTELFKTVYFNSGKATITDNTSQLLDQAAAIMTKYSTAKFSISGYTDSTGSDKLNLKLSDDRVQAVKAYLVSKGVSADNLTAKGYGETSPIASNKTVKGRALNRRVEVKLMSN